METPLLELLFPVYVTSVSSPDQLVNPATGLVTCSLSEGFASLYFFLLGSRQLGQELSMSYSNSYS